MMTTISMPQNSIDAVCCVYGENETLQAFWKLSYDLQCVDWQNKTQFQNRLCKILCNCILQVFWRDIYKQFPCNSKIFI